MKPAVEYKYLNRNPAAYQENCDGGAVNSPQQNAAKYKEILHLLEILEFEPEQIEIVQKILAAIILLGEINFVAEDENASKIENTEVATQGKRKLFIRLSTFFLKMQPLRPQWWQREFLSLPL